MFWLSRFRVLFACLFGLILLVTNIYKALNCSQSFGCIDPYWTNFWLISFADGYHRRALLGHIVGSISGGILDYRILNAIAFIIAALAPAFVLLKYFSRYVQSSNWYLVFIVLLVGPTTTVFFEVAGDPLHIVFLLCLAYFFLAGVLPVIFSVILACVISILMLLIHEASLFIFVPAIYLIHCFSHQRKISLPFLAMTLVVTGGLFTVILSNQPLVESRAGLLLKDNSIYHAPLDALPSYMVLLQREAQAYFGSPYDFLIMIRKTIGAFAFPVVGLLLLSKLFKDRNLIGCFLCIFPFSLPLFVIAHDWGRFLIYILLIAMLLSSKLREDTTLFSGWWQTVYERMLAQVLRIEILVGALPLMAALYSAHGNYRIFGLKPDNVMPYCLGLLLMVLYSGKYAKKIGESEHA